MSSIQSPITEPWHSEPPGLAGGILLVAESIPYMRYQFWSKMVLLLIIQLMIMGRMHYTFYSVHIQNAQNLKIFINHSNFYLQKNIDVAQKAYDGNTPKDYAKRKFGKLNSMLWKLTATLKQDAVCEIQKRARTRRLSTGAPEPPVDHRQKNRTRRRSVADMASVKSDYRV